MSKEVSILLVGIGGYGNVYVNELLNKKTNYAYNIKGVVDIKPKNCKNLEKIYEMNIPVYSSMSKFYNRNTADLAIISSPIQLHCEQTCFALSHGSYVLCEKPVSATIQEALKMSEMCKKTSKFVAVGYQWSFSESIQALKGDILKGVFGKPRRLKTIVLWPRNLEYYSRSWAGKMQDESGRWILDSVANNATSHYLHNMLYILGNKVNESAFPRFITAELYRANSIDNFDTSVIQIITDNNVEIIHYASHATKDSLDVTFEYEFENARVLFNNTDDENARCIKAVFNDRTQKEYGNPGKDNNIKLWRCIKAAGEGIEIPCGIEAASSQTLCINGAQESMPDICEFPKNIIRFDEALNQIWVEGLSETMKNCYDNWLSPGQMNIPWSKRGKEIDMKCYNRFNGGKLQGER